MQVQLLQVQINELYKTTFSGVDVTYKRSQSVGLAGSEQDENITESFPDLNESTFGLLGRQRQHVMKVSSLFIHLSAS